MSDTQNPPIMLRLFGGADIRGLERGAADSLMGQPKMVALLAYLVIAGADGAWLRRDTLATLLWPELDQSHARAALRKGVLVLRGALGQEALLSRGDEELRLADGLIECDVVVFGRHFDNALLAESLDAYRGELLPGFFLTGCVEFERWLEGQRAEMRERATAAAWAMAQMLEKQAKQTDAALWARKAVRFSWDDERTLRRTLALLDRVGDRAGALKLYDLFAKRLKADFGAQPSEETLTLVRQLRG